MGDKEKLDELKSMTPIPTQRFLFPCEHRVFANPNQGKEGNPQANVALCMEISRRTGHARGVSSAVCATCQLETGQMNPSYIKKIVDKTVVNNLSRVRSGFYPKEDALKMFKVAYDEIGGSLPGRNVLRFMMEECMRLGRFDVPFPQVAEFIGQHLPELLKDEKHEQLSDAARSSLTRGNASGKFDTIHTPGTSIDKATGTGSADPH